MGLWVRTALGVALLAALPFGMLLLFGGLIMAEAMFLSQSVGTALRWAIIIGPAGLVLGKGLLVLTSKIDDPVPGLPLTEREQPDLWGLVRRLAEVAGTRPPDEIYLTADANASVMETTRLLGLVSARRRMFVGAPLVAGLREDQLAAVLTHELAHYGNRDTRFSGMAYRGRRAFVSTVSALDRTELLQRFIAMLLTGYMKLYLRASTGLARRQERAADEAAAQAVGSGAAASALREIPAIKESWELFFGNHMVMGWEAGYLPSDVFGGYAELRMSLSTELDRIRQHPPEDSTPYDTHPPINTRVTAIEAMRAAPVLELGRREGVDVLRDAMVVLDAALMSGLVPEARDKRRADWEVLTNAHGLAAASSAATEMLAEAAKLTGRERTVRNLLDTLDAGRVAELAVTKPTPDMGPRARRELARPAVHEGLSAVVQVALAGAGVARWEPAWPNHARFVADEPYATELTALIDNAVADRGDTAGLRNLLGTANVDLDRTTAAR